MGVNDTTRFMTLDYISLYWSILFFIGAYFIRTGKLWLDCFLIYAWVYASWMVHFPFNTGETAAVKISIEHQQSIFLCLLMGLSLLIKKEICSIKIRNFLKWLGVVSIVCSFLAVFYGFFADSSYAAKFCHWMNGHHPEDNTYRFNFWPSGFVSGLIPNKSMNAIFNIMLLPFAAEFGFVAYLANLVLLYFAKSSSAFLTMGVVTFSWLMMSRAYWQVKAALSTVGVILFTVVGMRLIPNFTVDGDRFKGYKLFFSEFEWVHWLIGAGPSSFMTYGTLMQQKYNFYKGWYWVYMHSDPLQYLFEFGVLGLFPLLILLIGFFKAAGRETRLAGVAVITGGLVYYPMHQAPFLMVIFLLLKLASQSPANSERVSS